MKLYHLIFTFLFISLLGKSQDKNYIFFGEGQNQTVKLFWMPKEWPTDLVGFDIKRRTVKGEKKGKWIQINQSVIIPESSINKDLSNVEKDNKELQALIQWRAAHMSDNDSLKIKLSEYTNNDMIDDFTTNNDKLKSLSLILNYDYNIALSYGFALVDRNTSKAKAYEYGLFPHFKNTENNKPVSVFKWVYGTSSQESLSMNPSFKANIRKTKVDVSWEIDSKEYKEKKQISGFDIYRKENNKPYTKMNSSKIWINTSQKKAYLYYKDSKLEKDITYTYAAVPVSIFNSAGTMSEIVFNPTTLPGEIDAPILHYKYNKWEDFKSLNLTWKFSAENEKFIKGFKLQRQAHPDSSFVDVSNVLSAELRLFSDKNPPHPTGKYYHYKLVALMDGRADLWSNVITIIYNPIQKMLPPQNLYGVFVQKEDSAVIYLKWNEKPIDDTTTIGYQIYSNRGLDPKVSKEGSISPIKSNTYEYLIEKNRGTSYRFGVTCMSEARDESEMSRIIQVFAPSKHIPNIDIWPIEVNEKKVSLHWKYPNDIPDLVGFKIYKDGEFLIKVSKDLREWTSAELEAKKHTFEIRAVTKYMVESKMSVPRYATVRNND